MANSERRFFQLAGRTTILGVELEVSVQMLVEAQNLRDSFEINRLEVSLINASVFQNGNYLTLPIQAIQSHGYLRSVLETIRETRPTRQRGNRGNLNRRGAISSRTLANRPSLGNFQIESRILRTPQPHPISQSFPIPVPYLSHYQSLPETESIHGASPVQSEWQEVTISETGNSEIVEEKSNSSSGSNEISVETEIETTKNI